MIRAPTSQYVARRKLESNRARYLHGCPPAHLPFLMDRQSASRGQTGAGVVADLRPLAHDAPQAAAMLLAEGMRDNPLHLKVFGPDPVRRERRLRRFLGHLVGHVRSNGMLFGAYAHNELVGVLGMMRPGGCRPAGRDWLRFAGAILSGNPPQVVLRSARWLAAWARNDPPEAHWHLGPMAVRPAFRRQGIARGLMRHGCEHIDSLGDAAFLETDLAINAAFYESLGFVVVRHEPVLGVPNWFMRRAPRGGSGPRAALR